MGQLPRIGTGNFSHFVRYMLNECVTCILIFMRKSFSLTTFRMRAFNGDVNCLSVCIQVASTYYWMPRNAKPVSKFP